MIIETKIKGIIFFGDSVLAGTGAPEREKSCAKLVKSALEIPISLRARNWNTSQDGLARLEDDVLKQSQFSHVVLLFGNNDGWLIGPNQPKVTLDQFRKNLYQIVDLIQQNRQIPLFCNLQLINEKLLVKQFPYLEEFQKKMDINIEQIQTQYNEVVEKVVEKYKINLIDIRTQLKNSHMNTIFEDGIHPNDDGHQIIARTILRNLKDLEPFLQLSSKNTNHIERD